MSIYHTNNDRIPFTYLLTHKISGKRYYGCRTAKNCHPNELWIKYFSSSKIIHDIIDKEGANAFVAEVRLICESRNKALLFEEKFLTRIKAARRHDWFNQSNGNNKFVCTGHTKESCLKMSADRSGPKNPMYGKKRVFSPATIQKMKQSRSGEKHHFYGKTLSKEHTEAISRTLTGRTLPDAQIAKMIKTKIANNTTGKGVKKSAIHKMKMKAYANNRSSEHQANLAKSLKGRSMPACSADRKLRSSKSNKNCKKYQCNYCKRWMQQGNLTRWHNDKCKDRLIVARQP